MKTTLKVSLLLNLVLTGSLIFVCVNRNRQKTIPAPASSQAKLSPPPAATSVANSVPSKTPPLSFRWSQLESSKSYQQYIANLRAIGCPEPTIEDIVRGDADRAFSWERQQLGLGASGVGPWSRQAEMQLVASLLDQRTPSTENTAVAQNDTESQEQSKPVEESSGTPAFSSSAANPTRYNTAGEIAQTSGPSESAVKTAPSYPLFLQNVNWSAMGFTPSQQATIAQARQQFLNEIGGLNQNSSDPASQNNNPAGQNPGNSDPITPWSKVLPPLMEQLRESLGPQGWMAYEQAQYYAWYQPQVLAAGGGPLTINPDAFSMQ